MVPLSLWGPHDQPLVSLEKAQAHHIRRQPPARPGLREQTVVVMGGAGPWWSRKRTPPTPDVCTCGGCACPDGVAMGRPVTEGATGVTALRGRPSVKALCTKGSGRRGRGGWQWPPGSTRRSGQFPRVTCGCDSAAGAVPTPSPRLRRWAPAGSRALCSCQRKAERAPRLHPSLQATRQRFRQFQTHKRILRVIFKPRGPGASLAGDEMMKPRLPGPSHCESATAPGCHVATRLLHLKIK